MEGPSARPPTSVSRSTLCTSTLSDGRPQRRPSQPTKPQRCSAFAESRKSRAGQDVSVCRRNAEAALWRYRRSEDSPVPAGVRCCRLRASTKVRSTEQRTHFRVSAPPPPPPPFACWFWSVYRGDSDGGVQIPPHLPIKQKHDSRRAQTFTFLIISLQQEENI